MNLLGADAVLASNALSGKTALICGASRGIGAATARVMAAAGATPSTCWRTGDSRKRKSSKPCNGFGRYKWNLK